MLHTASHEITHTVSHNGNQAWKMDGLLHRLDGPAFIEAGGREEWWAHGKLHRVDGPARNYISGLEEWYSQGLLHRVDGPAIIWPEIKLKKWYVNGELHRVDGPAVITKRSKEWWQHNKWHRLNGPAFVKPKLLFFKKKSWFLFGENTTKAAVKEFQNLLVKHFGPNEISKMPYEVLAELYKNNKMTSGKGNY